MNTRNKCTISLIAFGCLLLAVGIGVDSSLSTLAGLFSIALAVRYRRKPSLWEYAAFFVLAVVLGALAPLSSPLIGAIPLMLSYVLDYIDEQRQKRTASAPATVLAAGARHAEGGAQMVNRVVEGAQNVATR